MKLIFLESTRQELPTNTIFGQILIFDKYFKSYGNKSKNRPLFGIDHFQIFSYHVTQGRNLSFPYSKSYFPLNFRTSHHILRFCCIFNGGHKEDNPRAGRISNQMLIIATDTYP